RRLVASEHRLLRTAIGRCKAIHVVEWHVARRVAQPIDHQPADAVVAIGPLGLPREALRIRLAWMRAHEALEVRAFVRPPARVMPGSGLRPELYGRARTLHHHDVR